AGIAQRVRANTKRVANSACELLLESRLRGKKLILVDHFPTTREVILLAKWNYGFQEECVRPATCSRAVIPAEDKTRRPIRAAHRSRIRSGSCSAHHISWFERFRMRQASHGNLCGPVGYWKNRKARGPRIHRTRGDVPAILIWLRAVKTTEFEAHSFVLHADRRNFISDVSRVLPMMADRRFRKFRGRGAMRKRDRPKGRVADGREIRFEHGVIGNRPRIMKPQSHHQIVRVLPVLDRLAESSLASLKKERILAVADCCRLGAQHYVEKEVAPT